MSKREDTIKELRDIADDLEKGCGGFDWLVGVDLSTTSDITVYTDINQISKEITHIRVVQSIQYLNT